MSTINIDPRSTQRTPDPQRVRSRVTASLVSGTATQAHVEARNHVFTIDEPDSFGGDDRGATPVEHLLAALAACQVITIQVWAQKLGIAVDTVNVDVDGDLDLRGFLGTAEDVRPGFEGINVAVAIGGPDPDDRYQELLTAVEQHCPVTDNLRSVVPVTTSLLLT